MTTVLIEKPEFLVRDADAWVRLVLDRLGMDFSGSRVRALGDRLWQRMQATGFLAYGDYLRHVSAKGEHSAEWQLLHAALLNHETSFFRDLSAFRALHERVLPTLFGERSRRGLPIKLCSAGCSRGQEAYSLAMVASDVARSAGVPLESAFLIEGLDISEEALAYAAEGVYRPFEIRMLPPMFARCLRPEAEPPPRGRVIDGIRAAVRFRGADLCAAPEPGEGPYDLIMCQNVLIYFDQQWRERIVKRLADQLTPDGWLLLAPAESLGLSMAGLRSQRVGDSLFHRRGG